MPMNRGILSTIYVRMTGGAGIAADRLSGRAILVSAIDNLVKGASGQAVQDMNVMLGLAETTGLAQEPLFP
jgi:N-acetyl-gamma-glutamyl-phosphate reductase